MHRTESTITDGTTGEMPDQSALHGVLGRIEALGLELIEVPAREAASGARGIGPPVNEVLVSFFESKQSVLRGRALVVCRALLDVDLDRRVVVLTREIDGSRSPYDVPRHSAVEGASSVSCSGRVVGSFAGEADSWSGSSLVCMAGCR